MKKVLLELGLEVEDVLVILSDKLDIVVSDTDCIDNLDDEIVNEVYAIAYSIYHTHLTWSKLLNK